MVMVLRGGGDAGGGWMDVPQVSVRNVYQGDIALFVWKN